jgi:hypothetical protein
VTPTLRLGAKGSPSVGRETQPGWVSVTVALLHGSSRPGSFKDAHLPQKEEAAHRRPLLVWPKEKEPSSPPFTPEPRNGTSKA